MKQSVYLIILCCFLICGFPCQAKSKHDRPHDALQYIQNGTTPYDYIADKLRNYKIVTIGEDHWIADHSEFLCDVLRNVGYTADTRIKNLAIEFGNESDQLIADTLAFSKTWNEALAHKILFDAPDVFGNPYKGYRDVLYTVWETNQQKPDSLKTRILLVDPSDTPKTPEARDENIARILRNCIRGKGKTIFYAGQAHTQYQIRGQLARGGKGYYYNYPSASKMIKICYPNDIFAIILWGGFMGSYGYIPDELTTWTLIDGGDIDKAFELNNNVPVGFDIDASFPLTPSQLYAGKGSGRTQWPIKSENGNPYRGDLTIADYCDGIIFLKPVKDFRGMQLIDIYNDARVDAIADRIDSPQARTKNEIFTKILEWHPTCIPISDK